MRIKSNICCPVGGLEEVFAAVGESVSLACRNTSSLSFTGNTEWTVTQKTLTKAFCTSKHSSLVIDKLSPQQAGDYQCAESSGQRNVFNKVRLHTFDGRCEKLQNKSRNTVLRYYTSFFFVYSDCKKRKPDFDLCAYVCRGMRRKLQLNLVSSRRELEEQVDESQQHAHSWADSPSLA